MIDVLGTNCERLHRPTASAELTAPYRKPKGRAHLVRVKLGAQDGKLRATPTGDQSSGILLSMVEAQGLAYVPDDCTELEAGDRVTVQLLERDDLVGSPGF